MTATTRVLVIATHVPPTHRLRDALDVACGNPRVLVVAPVLCSRLELWTSGDSRARCAAQERARGCLDALARLGFDADAILGDADPVLAAEDALRRFRADTVVVCAADERVARSLPSGVRVCEVLPETSLGEAA